MGNYRKPVPSWNVHFSGGNRQKQETKIYNMSGSVNIINKNEPRYETKENMSI